MRILALAATSLLLCTALAAQVANDECTGAVAVSSGTNGPFQNIGATQSLPTWPCNAGFGTDVWFVYVPSCNGTATFDTCGAFFDTVMQVFEVGACSGNSCANRFAAGGPCNNDWCGQQSRVTMSVAADCRYYIRVAGAGALWGTFPLNINCTGAAAGPLDERCSGATPVVTGTNG